MVSGEDAERGRAGSAAERQKSIVSMTEFEGMDEYTALQKYILFYRDPRAAGHHQEVPKMKKKKWWQSGGGQAVGGADLAAEVPNDCKYSLISSPQHVNWQSAASCIGPSIERKLHWAIIVTPAFGSALHRGATSRMNGLVVAPALHSKIHPAFV